MLRSVRNQLIDWERTKKDTSSIEEEERSFKLSVSVEESFISDEEDLLLKKRVNRILDLLTDHQREIVYLHFIEEIGYFCRRKNYRLIHFLKNKPIFALDYKVLSLTTRLILILKLFICKL